VLVGAGGTLYVPNIGSSAGTGQVPRLTLVPEPAPLFLISLVGMAIVFSRGFYRVAYE
jgi:hypothetical protein